MTLLDVGRVVYFFGPAYVADVSPIRAERLFPRFDVPHVPPPGVVLAVLPLVFVSDIVATTLFWRFGLKQSWI
jgi:hypothetical protein